MWCCVFFLRVLLLAAATAWRPGFVDHAHNTESDRAAHRGRELEIGRASKGNDLVLLRVKVYQFILLLPASKFAPHQLFFFSIW